MGLFKEKSYVDPRYHNFTKDVAKTIETLFNTRVYDFGVAEVGSHEFNFLTTKFNTNPLQGSKYIVYFLVPIDDCDNIITNDYYEKCEQINGGVNNSPLSIFTSISFTSTLKRDIEISNYLERRMQTTVYSTGSLKVSNYEPNDNIVKNATEIDDLRYRIFRYFAC